MQPCRASTPTRNRLPDVWVHSRAVRGIELPRARSVPQALPRPLRVRNLFCEAARASLDPRRAWLVPSIIFRQHALSEEECFARRTTGA